MLFQGSGITAIGNLSNMQIITNSWDYQMYIVVAACFELYFALKETPGALVLMMAFKTTPCILDQARHYV